jgi:alpha-1,2-mannosyltransferase
MECAAAIAAMAMLSLAGFALTCLISFRKLQIDPRLGWFLALGALSLQPVHQTFEIGQINLVLMALVMLDCLVLPPRYRGLGVGIAAAVKIIPGIFVVYFVLRRDWRAVAQSSATFAATVLASAIVTPHETMSYWTQLMSAAARTGDTISSVNQSLPAVLARPMHDRPPDAGGGARRSVRPRTRGGGCAQGACPRSRSAAVSPSPDRTAQWVEQSDEPLQDVPAPAVSRPLR